MKSGDTEIVTDWRKKRSAGAVCRERTGCVEHLSVCLANEILECIGQSVFVTVLHGSQYENPHICRPIHYCKVGLSNIAAKHPCPIRKTRCKKYVISLGRIVSSN